MGSQQGIDTFVGLIDTRRAELRAAAQPPGERVFAEKPKRLADRFHSYRDVWKNGNH